jgi:hypothetical protein
MISSMSTTNNGRRISKSKSFPRWRANIQTSQMTGKEKVVIKIITISMAVAVAVVIAMERGGRGGHGRGRGGRDGRGNNSEHLQSVECYNCGKKGHYSTDCSLPKKNNQSSNMVSKDDFKNLFQTSMKEIFTKKDKKAKTNAEGDEDSLDMNVFKKLMEGKQQMFVNQNNDDLISINDTNTCDNSMQNKCTH